MTNVISADRSANKHYLHTGFSASISSSYTSPGAVPRGITWDGTNVISADGGSADKHYLHTGFSATVSSSYASPGVSPSGITWDGRFSGAPADPEGPLVGGGKLVEGGILAGRLVGAR